jgi:hypothetical protein
MRRKARELGISPVLVDDNQEHQDGLDLIAAARRQHQQRKTYDLDPSKTFDGNDAKP